MKNMKHFLSFTTLIMSTGLVLGCGDERAGAMDFDSAKEHCAAEQGSALSFASCQLAIPVMATSPSIEREMLSTMTAYVRALELNDFTAVQDLISVELRDRIEARGQGPTLASKLQSFVSHQRENLVRSMKTSRVTRRALRTISSEMLADGSMAAVSLALDQNALPKPFYFVLEDGSYKLNIVKPDIGILEGNTYAIKNEDGVNRSFTCTGGSGTVSPGQTLNRFCSDNCGWFDGTVFTVNGGSASCDYNTWGIDMYIRNNSVVCADRC